jgi:hypothetical protein
MEEDNAISGGGSLRIDERGTRASGGMEKSGDTIWDLAE